LSWEDPPPPAKPEHAEAFARIEASRREEEATLARIAEELLRARGEFTVADLVDHWGLEEGGWTMHERGDDRIDARRRCFGPAKRWLDNAVARGELAKEQRLVRNWLRAYYRRNGTP
jgi:hypothetical protein